MVRESSDGDGPDSARKIVGLVTQIVAPLTLITALLFYFAWVREGAVFGYFGLDQTVLGFSSTDYLLRSADIAFRPIAVLALVTVGLLAAYALLRRFGSGGRWTRTLRIGIVMIGVAASTYGLAVLFGWIGLPSWHTWPPLALLIGAGMIEIGATPSRRPADRDATPDGPAHKQKSKRNRSSRERNPGSTVRIWRRLAGALLVALAAFWATAIYAQDSGSGLAESIGANPSSRPGAILYAKSDLGITGPGVTEIPGPLHSEYPVEYKGLRFLIHAGGQWLFLPERYNHDAGDRVISVPDDGASIRVELCPASSHNGCDLS